ncbi:MAG: hypothetical protein U0893_04185 [Chloroflexota bacterium]
MAEETRTTGHLDLDTIADYVEMKLSAGEERPIEMHLAHCDLCTDLAREARELSELWDGWTARSHAEATLAALMQGAVEQAAAVADAPALRERLTRWAESWSGSVEAAVRVVMDAAGQASRVVTEGLDAVARPGSAWQFTLAPAPTPTRGGRGRGAVPPPPAVAEASIGGAGRVRVAVNGERHDVVVRLDALPADQEPPLVLLVPVSGGGEPRVAEPERQPGIAYLIARFNRLPAGEYLVAFEPRSP